MIKTSKNRKNCSKRIGPLIDQLGNTVVDNKEMAALLNNYFATVFTKKISNNFVVDNLEAKCTEMTLQDICITDNDVIKAISEFKEHKSPGIDGITSTYAIKTKEILAKPLRLLYNCSRPY